MAKIYADLSGNLLRFLQTEAEEESYGAPVGAVHAVDFDEATNAALVADISANWGQYAVSALGVLTKSDVPVVIAPDGQRRADFKALATIRAKLAADTQPTVAEIRQWMRWVTRSLR